MTKFKALFAFAVISSLFSTLAQSNEFVVSYDGFYDRLKVVNKGDFQFAQVNFYITDIATGDACLIKSGRIITERQEFALNFTDKAQLLLPFDQQLDKDKAVIVIEPINEQHDCQLKLQIEAREFANNNLNRYQMYQLNAEFDDLLSDLSGFFITKLMSFLLPEQKGLVLTFAQTVNIKDKAFSCKDAVCHVAIPDEWEDDKTVFNIPPPLVKVTPWIAN